MSYDSPFGGPPPSRPAAPEPQRLPDLSDQELAIEVRAIANKVRAQHGFHRTPTIDVWALEEAARRLAPNAPCLAEYEARCLRQALIVSGQDRLRAASLLGIGKSTLYRRLKRAGLT
jgi:DNA-binding NtrC family response regulator